MKDYSRFSTDYSDSILSIFDIGAVLFRKDSILQSKGLEGDLERLSHDQVTLENDFRIASNRILKQVEKQSND